MIQNIPSVFLKKTVRVKKEDSAFFYFILESYEGIVSYSTLDCAKEVPYRDIELRIPPDFLRETEDVLSQLDDLIYRL